MRDRPLLCACLFVVASLILAVTAAGDSLIRELRPSKLERCLEEGEQVQAEGTVCRIEEKTKVQAVYLKRVSIRCRSASFYENNLIIYTDPGQLFKIGNRIKVQGEVSFFEEAANPGNFDQKRYYQIRGIHGLIWAGNISVSDRSVCAFRQRLAEFRNGWRKMLITELGDQNGTVLAAIMLGEKAGMEPELKSLYQANGIGHILAISGLHLSLIGLGAYRLLRRLTGSYLAGGAAGILFLGTYVLMIGVTVSAARAAVMFLFRVGADMSGRHYDAPTALGTAAAVVLLWRPLYLYDGGFWMSFGAVSAMIVILPLFRELPMQGLWASISVNLFLTPVILRCFFEIPVYSIFLNLYVIPLLSVLLVLGMAGSMLYLLLPSLGGLFLAVCGIVLWIYEKSCEWALTLPGARWVAGRPALWQMAVYYILLGIIICLNVRSRKRTLKKRKKRRFLYFTLVLPGVLVLCCRFGERGSFQTAVLDVGQGDCIFLRGPHGNNYLVDGGSSDVEEVGRYRIESYLKAVGAGTIDYVIISHGDEDHINGIEELIGRRKIGVSIRRIVLPPEEAWNERLQALACRAGEAGILVYTMKPGDKIIEGDLKITCLAPSLQEGLTPGNEASMVLAVEFGAFDMLLTGDVENEGEERLLKSLEGYSKGRTWEVLKAAHHGSGNATSVDFLKIIRPRYTVISAGADNPYGHPHEDTLERLRNAGSSILKTPEHGMILFRVHKNRMFLRQMRGG